MTDQPQTPQAPRNPPLINYAWMAVAAVTPIVMLMPPRRMDARFMILSGAFSISTDQLLREYTGHGIYERFARRINSAMPSALPEKAQDTQRRLREERARIEAALPEEERRALEEQRRKPTGLWGLFKADEGENWREKRLEEHRKGMEEGKGISDLIQDHMSEAFGKKKEGKDDEKKDEKR